MNIDIFGIIGILLGIVCFIFGIIHMSSLWGLLLIIGFLIFPSLGAVLDAWVLGVYPDFGRHDYPRK